MPTHTSLKGWNEYGEPGLTEQLEANLSQFFNWGFLGIGGFWNVEMPESGAYGGDFSRLRPVFDRNFNDVFDADEDINTTSVWEGARQDWIWESGIEYDIQPIRVSGVWVDDVFYGLDETGVYKHHINYPLGRVVFDAPIPTTRVVQCNHSFRRVQFTTSEVDWWRELQERSMRVDDSQFLQEGSGAWDVLAQSRIQMPAVVVQAVTRSDQVPLEVGSSANVVSQDVLFHIVAETNWERGKIHDIITGQKDKRIIGFDKQAMFDGSGFPLDENGSPIPSGNMYPDLIKPSAEGGYGWRQIRFSQMSGSDSPDSATAPLFYGVVRGTFEVDLP